MGKKKVATWVATFNRMCGRSSLDTVSLVEAVYAAG